MSKKTAEITFSTKLCIPILNYKSIETGHAGIQRLKVVSCRTEHDLWGPVKQCMCSTLNLQHHNGFSSLNFAAHADEHETPRIIPDSIINILNITQAQN